MTEFDENVERQVLLVSQGSAVELHGLVGTAIKVDYPRKGRWKAP